MKHVIALAALIGSLLFAWVNRPGAETSTRGQSNVLKRSPTIVSSTDVSAVEQNIEPTVPDSESVIGPAQLWSVDPPRYSNFATQDFAVGEATAPKTTTAPLHADEPSKLQPSETSTVNGQNTPIPAG